MASVLKVDKLDPQSGTALEIGSSGDTISVPSGATLDISSATLTPPATLPASSGVNLTALNATNLGSGTVPTARLGSGTASSSTILYGDNTWAAAGGFECEEYDIWHLTVDFDGDAAPIDSNLARYATNFELIGTGMSESSGIFTFPSTGKWLVSFTPHFYLSEVGDNDKYMTGLIQLEDGTDLTMCATTATYISSNTTIGGYCKTLVDVTSTSTVKVRFSIDVTQSGVTCWGGGAANLNTGMHFFKLGAT
ncbi:MAG: hypothetical protein QF535_12520 [Anaerolineales bacterium]|nr:hypothetical protein [Anaerolineales bacterium]